MLSLATWTGAFLFPWKAMRTNASTSGSMRSSATSRPRLNGRSDRADPEAWKTWWVPGQTDPPVKPYYFIGKDNIPFHAIIWPAMLMGYGNRNLPYDVPANEFMTMSGAKASSSRGNVIWTRDVLDAV